MADDENGHEIDPLQDESVGEFDAEAEVALDDTVENEPDADEEAGQEEGVDAVEDPVSISCLRPISIDNNPKWSRSCCIC